MDDGLEAWPKMAVNEILALRTELAKRQPWEIRAGEWLVANPPSVPTQSYEEHVRVSGEKLFEHIDAYYEKHGLRTSRDGKAEPAEDRDAHNMGFPGTDDEKPAPIQDTDCQVLTIDMGAPEPERRCENCALRARNTIVCVQDLCARVSHMENHLRRDGFEPRG